MATRGRKSAAFVSLVAENEGNVGPLRRGRPAPHPRLTKRQAEIWNEVVNTEAEDMFVTPALQLLLAEYCAHSETFEKLTSFIERIENRKGGLKLTDLADYNKLLMMRDRESAAISKTATKLRITNQSRYTPVRAQRSLNRQIGKSGGSGRPWES